MPVRRRVLMRSLVAGRKRNFGFPARRLLVLVVRVSIAGDSILIVAPVVIAFGKEWEGVVANTEQ